MPGVRPIAVVRRSRIVDVDGITCCLEAISAAPSLRMESFAIEHEDPALVKQLLTDLGLGAGANTSFLQGLKHGLGLSSNEPGRQPWARKSNVSSS
jgi:hypothetical protein